MNVSTKKPNKIPGIVLSAIQLGLTIAFIAFVTSLNILPGKYYLAVIFILLVLLGISLYTQLAYRAHRTGKVVAVITCLILAVGSAYLFQMKSALASISGTDTKVDKVSIIVLKDNPAATINDAADYSFGIQERMDRTNTDDTIQNINDHLNTEIRTTSYTDLNAQINALYGGETDAIILNEAYREMIVDDYADFNETTRVLSDYRIETPVVIEDSGNDVTKVPFTVYISGIDSYGSVFKTSRSDVNILATVNPVTKQILLTTTPRDYYVAFPISNGQRDKLTHAGVYGIDVSIGALEALYDIKIDYYVRVNFSSLIQMVDVLGGITVQSDYAFSAGGYQFKVGENLLDGQKALAFSRERYSFTDGDNQRGRNQLLVINGMIKKAFSPSILTNFSGILDNISGSFETNMKAEEMTGLARMQINDMAAWEIQNSSVTGSGASLTSYSYPDRPLYVMLPNEASVEAAKQKMQQILNPVTTTPVN